MDKHTTKTLIFSALQAAFWRKNGKCQAHASFKLWQIVPLKSLASVTSLLQEANIDWLYWRLLGIMPPHKVSSKRWRLHAYLVTNLKLKMKPSM